MDVTLIHALVAVAGEAEVQENEEVDEKSTGAGVHLLALLHS